MWYLMPPMNEEEAKKWGGHQGRYLHSLESEVIELSSENDRGSAGTAWVYRGQKSTLAKELFSRQGKGILFARKNGAGIGVTYSVQGNTAKQIAKFSLLTVGLTRAKLRRNTPYRVGGVKNIFGMANEASKIQVVVQVVAMTKNQFQARHDGVFFHASDRLAYNTLLNELQDVGIINTDMIKYKRPKGKGGGMIELRDDDDDEGGSIAL